MQVYSFSWCVFSFDQQCYIKANSEEKAKEIFNKEIRDKDSTSVWAAHYATVSNLNEKYIESWIDKNITIHFFE